MQKTDKNRVVVPFTGYLHPESPPTPPQNQIAAPPLITFGVLLFAGGLAIGAISVRQSAGYDQVEALKNQAQRLSEIQQQICNY